MKTLTTSLALGAAFASGCYGASFDPGANAVFACAEDADCPAGTICVLQVCIADDGPQLKVNGPEGPFQAYAAGTTEFDLAVVDTSNQSFELGKPGTADGYVRIFLDGKELDPIVSGNLAQGFGRKAVPIPDPVVGVHRLRVIVVDPTGEPIVFPGASGDRVFMVSDGANTPQLAVVEPFPQWDAAPLVVRDIFEVGVPFSLVIAGNGFEWTDPSGTEHVPGQHHTHVYLLDDYPACLPDCNNDYVASLKPGASTVTDDDLVNGEAATTLPTEPTRLRVTTGLQWNSHTPYPAASLDDPDWTAEIRDGVVNDAVEIEFFSFD